MYNLQFTVNSISISLKFVIPLDVGFDASAFDWIDSVIHWQSDQVNNGIVSITFTDFQIIAYWAITSFAVFAIALALPETCCIWYQYPSFTDASECVSKVYLLHHCCNWPDVESFRW